MSVDTITTCTSRCIVAEDLVLIHIAEMLRNTGLITLNVGRLTVWTVVNKNLNQHEGAPMTIVAKVVEANAVKKLNICECTRLIVVCHFGNNELLKLMRALKKNISLTSLTLSILFHRAIVRKAHYNPSNSRSSTLLGDIKGLTSLSLSNLRCTVVGNNTVNHEILGLIKNLKHNNRLVDLNLGELSNDFIDNNMIDYKGAEALGLAICDNNTLATLSLSNDISNKRRQKYY